MYIESPRYTERFGSVRINDVQKVVALDSGLKSEIPPYGAMGVVKISEETIKSFEDRMAIVVPIKNEKLKLFEGVISGIPHDCLVIVVSNSQRETIDRFRMESDTLNQMCRYTHRQALIIHQKDTKVAEAMKQAGYDELLDENGLVGDGKAEAMVIGLLMAKLAGKEYVGFVDADNYSPGSVLEYVRNYAAGFSMAKSPYAMVRILWHYKPKFSGGLYFKKWGRVSEITNRCFNSLISSSTGFETNVIKTGNAGEHAMTLKLAELLPYASGYAVEPQELVSIFEQLGGSLPSDYIDVAKHGIDLFQIETRNPHLHEEKGIEHLGEMLLAGLSTIYHSALCDEDTRQLIMSQLASQKALTPRKKPPKPHLNRPPHEVNTREFARFMEPHLKTYFALHEL
jgi:mannosyl-3-phosphoglycerate synthase